jgi:hypothetical protein
MVESRTLGEAADYLNSVLAVTSIVSPVDTRAR